MDGNRTQATWPPDRSLWQARVERKNVFLSGSMRSVDHGLRRVRIERKNVSLGGSIGSVDRSLRRVKRGEASRTYS